jgi:hypothetical protein
MAVIIKFINFKKYSAEFLGYSFRACLFQLFVTFLD